MCSLWGVTSSYASHPLNCMTSADTNMTSDASSPTVADHTVLAALVAGNLAAARTFGLDADRCATAAGLLPSDLADPDGRVPFARHAALLEAMELEPRALEFGLWMGATFNAGALGVVGYVMQHAP